jgi:hypothetical protein
MSTHHISRAQWAQIEKRVKQAKHAFDPKWKCLIDGTPWPRAACAHTEADQHDIIAKVKERAA